MSFTDSTEVFDQRKQHSCACLSCQRYAVLLYRTTLLHLLYIYLLWYVYVQYVRGYYRSLRALYFVRSPFPIMSSLCYEQQKTLIKKKKPSPATVTIVPTKCCMCGTRGNDIVCTVHARYMHRPSRKISVLTEGIPWDTKATLVG